MIALRLARPFVRYAPTVQHMQRSLTTVATIVQSQAQHFEDPNAVRAAMRKARMDEDKRVLSKACGDIDAASDEPEMVDIRNAETGEINGPRGKEPTRYGDWEAKGRCWDF